MLCRGAIGGLHRPGIRMSDRSRCSPARGLAAPDSRTGWNEGAFSLLEIVVVLALLGLISALLIGGSTTLLRTVTADDIQNTALGAIAGARHSAVLTGRTLEFRYDEKNRVLDWGEGQAALAGEGELRLLPPARVSSFLVGGRLVESPLARVRFYPDGTCDPFRLEVVRDKTGDILAIDPWTCTVLSPEATPGLPSR